MSAVSAIAAAFAGAHPTGTTVVDPLYSAAFGLLLPLAAASSRRWPWPIVAGVATVIADTIWGRALGASALAFAFYGLAFAKGRDRLTGAAIGALSAQAMLQGGGLGFHGATVLAGMAVTAMVLISAYRNLRKSTRRKAQRLVSLAGLVVILGCAGVTVAAISARTNLQRAVERTRSGLNAAESGRQSAAGADWQIAAASFQAADEDLDRPWVKVAYLIPVVAQHARAVSGTAHSGVEIASSAANAATVAPYRDLHSTDGTFNLELIARMQKPVAATAAALVHARKELHKVDDQWLVSPLRRQLADYDSQLNRAIPQATRATQALEVAPGILGAYGTRRYLLIFGTPSESRGLGGFIGSWGELTATNGDLSMAKHGSIGALDKATPWQSRKITGLPEFVNRYSYAQPTRFLQNISASPDFPTVANVFEQLYPQAGGQHLDGVIYLDPYALASLLELTGPVSAEGIPFPLTATNAAQFLLHDQYVQFPDVDERRDLLSNALKATFEALTHRSLPTIARAAEVLSPRTRQGRLLFVTNHHEETNFLTSIGLAGIFPKPDGGDFLSVRISNGNPNKIDYYLHQSVDYDVRYDPLTGATSAIATITLRNDAPSSGEPPYVLGNQDTEKKRADGHPFGSNTLQYILYSPMAATRLSVDGVTEGVEVQRELGYFTNSGSVTIPAGGKRVVKIELSGSLNRSDTYRLRVLPQPLVNDTHMRIAVRPGSADTRIKASGVNAFGIWQFSGDVIEPKKVSLPFSRS